MRVAMPNHQFLRLAILPVAAAALTAAAAPAPAQDFFSGLFGGFAFPAPVFPPAIRPPPSAPRKAQDRGSGQAYCVRTCDGRYFPLASAKSEAAKDVCRSLCPAAETRVFFGSSIDHAATRRGERYPQLANAFRYRDELVAGCTCNGKSPGGLAHIAIDDDPTVRKGDIVAGEQGLMVAGRSADRRAGALNFSPAPPGLRARFAHAPVTAAD